MRLRWPSRLKFEPRYLRTVVCIGRCPAINGLLSTGTEEEARARDDDFWKTFASKLTPPERSRMFIVEHHQRVAAFVFGVRKETDEYRIGGLWVDPVHRREGFGSVLLQQVVTWARADSPSAVVQLWCHTGPALSFYRKNGFHSLARFRTHESDGRQIVEMEWRDT
ncbi:GNAT family N-acetyltransferase [Paraburkholderia sp. MM5477-R1]|uniref:GNAT family N-acetyltransferase n=1 Tax=Paraburkholderia sp. MM5477-R1 TaxID=2991062 RepID=UPI003D21165B